MKLTQTVKKGGCAAKIPALVLREILSGVKFPPKIEGLTVDGSNFDDAAVFQISDSHSLVQTLDFFTPIVDSPLDFGAIAAANALSDVYAMGGAPKTCMAILGAPMGTMEPEMIQEVLDGACQVIAQAKASLVGGHSIDDDTLKFGLSVTGLVENEKTWTNEGACEGDVLILTKAIGTGTICAGIKQGKLDQGAQQAIESMKRLNNVVDVLDEDLLNHIHGATDITGFGLAGHGYQMAMASEQTFCIDSNEVPLFDETMASLKKEWLTKAHRSNEQYTSEHIQFHEKLSLLEKLVFFDPQTSGGLLMSVSQSKSEEMIDELKISFPDAKIIGKVMKPMEAKIIVE